VTHKKLTKFRSLRNYLRNKEGSTAIEFALLALPFSALLFAIVETAVVFFISSSISHALSEAGRDVRLGSFQQAGGVIPASTYQSSGGNDVVIARARFFHRLALPGNLTLLANRAGNIRLIEATTAFRNEPFN